MSQASNYLNIENWFEFEGKRTMSRYGHLTNLFIVTPLAMFGLMAGFFYAYSVSIMPGLNHAQPQVAIAAMQSFNITIRNPTFFVTFFLTIPIGFLGAIALWRFDQKRAAIWLIAASIIYLFGAVVPTGAVNVPMNEALGRESVPTDAAAAIGLWQTYAQDWTFWNSARTFATLLAMLICAGALIECKRPVE